MEKKPGTTLHKNKTRNQKMITVFLNWSLLILLSLVLLSACSGLQPQRVVCREYPEVRPTPEELFMLPDVRTPLPPEMVANREQTNGVLLGGIALVLIVVGGTLGVIWQNR